MKTIYTLSLLLFLTIPFSVYPQLKIKNNGKVIVGNESTLWTDSAANLSIYGPGINGALGKLSFGPFSKNQYGYYGTFIGEWKGIYGQKRLWLHGSEGFYFTTGYGTDNGTTNDANILLYYDKSVPEPAIFINKRTRVWGEVYAKQFLTTSDARLKTDIKKIDTALSRLTQLEGVTFHWSSEKTANAPISALSNNANDTANTQKKMSGFIAQELEKIFPDLVDTDADGYKSIDYIGLIPVIVEALKEQQALITAQNRKIEELQAGQNSTLESPLQARTTALTNTNEAKTINAFLYQNTPNPFSHTTEIRYYLPSEITSAAVYILTMEGTLIKNYPLDTRGEASVEIQASGLRPGMYIYTLVADNKEVDSKRMIITE